MNNKRIAKMSKLSKSTLDAMKKAGEMNNHIVDPNKKVQTCGECDYWKLSICEGMQIAGVTKRWEKVEYFMKYVEYPYHPNDCKYFKPTQED